MLNKSILKAIEELSLKQYNEEGCKRSRLSKMMEEVGELAQAIRVEDGLKKHKLSEPAHMEAVDCIIAAIDMYLVTGGELSNLGFLVSKKLKKWEKKFI